jgi:hypothetical protein
MFFFKGRRYLITLPNRWDLCRVKKQSKQGQDLRLSANNGIEILFIIFNKIIIIFARNTLW